MFATVRRWWADLSMYWKLIAPFAVLVLVLGGLGSFVLVRNISSRAQATLNQTLVERSLAARSSIHDRELYLLESADLAANLQGAADAVRAHDRAAASHLLESVLALKTDLTLLSITDATGNGLAQYLRPAAGQPPAPEPPASWSGSPLVGPVIASPSLTTQSSLLGFDTRALLAMATTVCAAADPCQPVGAVVVGVDATQVLSDAAGSGGVAARAERSGYAVFDTQGHRVAAMGRVAQNAPPPLRGSGFIRRTTHVGGTAVATVYAPILLQSRRAGTLAVSMPTGPAFAGARSAALRLGFLLVAAIVGIIAIATLLSRSILAQLRSLVTANTALAAGDLTARVPIFGNDELGRVAEGVNHMAGELEDSYRTLEAKVDERTAEVQRLLSERMAFFTAMSHEFRTPLAVILGQAELVEEPSQVILKDAGYQLLGFVNDILEIARIESGRLQLHPAPLRLQTLLATLRPTIESLAALSGLRASIKIPRRLPAVLADEAGLRQVILNLVDNAVKYTPRLGELSIDAEQRGQAVAVSIRDTGVGIPPEAADRLFEPFYRVEGAETQGGQPSSGLGLAVVRGLVEANGGKISVISRPGEGSTFSFTIPLVEPATKKMGIVSR